MPQKPGLALSHIKVWSPLLIFDSVKNRLSTSKLKILKNNNKFFPAWHGKIRISDLQKIDLKSKSYPSGLIKYGFFIATGFKYVFVK